MSDNKAKVAEFEATLTQTWTSRDRATKEKQRNYEFQSENRDVCGEEGKRYVIRLYEVDEAK